MSKNTKAKNRIMTLSRDKKLSHFYSLCGEGNTVLDVGVSTETKKGIPSRNYFLKNYRYSSGTYTGLGIQTLTGMRDLFKGKYFVQYSGGKFPFEEKAFDWVFSNAVIEHVGDSDDQILFINEMMRVANNVFFTTPNKYFPFESHTNVLFLHWNDDLFNQWGRRQIPGMDTGRLNLLSFNRLQKLLESSNATSFSIFKNRFLGIPMTFTVTCSDKY